MHPWIAGRIVETMQQQHRTESDRSRLGREAITYREQAHRHHRDHHIDHTEDHEPRRARRGLAVARFGLRIAGHPNGKALRPSLASGHDAMPSLNPEHWSNPWTTCGATSTPTR
jgi:hypothetical protein